MKPLFMWAGGKTKMLKHYIPIIPKVVESYCEPFFGAGAVFIHVKKTYDPKNIIINDINPDIMNIYRSIRDDSESFIGIVDSLERLYLSLPKEGRKKFYYDVRHTHAWEYECWSKTKESAVLFFLLKTGFNGIFQINKNTNGRFGTPSGLLNQKDRVYDREVLSWWIENLQDVKILDGDWKDAVKLAEKDSLFFLDPPYRSSFADYGNGFTENDTLSLIEFCRDKNMVMMTNRADDEWFEDKKGTLSIKYFDVTYTAGRRKKVDGGFEAKKAREILLYNLPPN